VTDATTCEGLDWTQFGNGAQFWSQAWSKSYLPPGCYIVTDTLTGYFNVHPTGTFPDAARPLICEQVPTPAPAPTRTPGVSGDPIVRIKGKLVKFDMPVKLRSLMWKDSMLEIFAEAEVHTPDMSSQWLSQIIVVSNGKDILKINRREITPTSIADANALNTLSVTTSNDTEDERKITGPGVYAAGQHKTDDLRITVALTGEKIGPLAKEVVSVKTTNLQFSVNAEIAKKFRHQKEKAFKYSHLDIQFQSMGGDVESGIFAELYGLVPMTAKTAKLIRSVKYEQ
jgi:hypothetical protein